jgi:predicted ferric reductase
MRGDPTFWLLARASGLTAYLLLTVSVLAGLCVKSKVLGPLARAAVVTDLHRFVSLLALGAIALHGLTLTLDSTVPTPVAALVVPGLSPYRPLATGIGVLAAELMILIYVSFSLRRRIGVRNWRRLHYSTFAVFAAATIHGIVAGTDRWALPLYAASVAAVVALTAWRILTKGETSHVPHRDRPRRLQRNGVVREGRA